MRIIAEFVRTLPNKPGVYRMIAADGEVLYVGKARSLRNRVAAYTQPTRLATRLIAHGVGDAGPWSSSVTDSEAEALLLENNLIKRFRPRFNVLLRDDKSFPYIVIRRRARNGRSSPSTAARATGKRVFRALRLGHRGQPHALRAAARLSAAVLFRRRVLDGAPGPACNTRSSAARRPASAASRSTNTTRSSRRCAASSAARNREIQQTLSQRMEEGFGQSRIRRRRHPARPHPRAHPDPVAPVDQPAVDRRGRHLRGPFRRWTDLRPGLLPARRPKSPAIAPTSPATARNSMKDRGAGSFTSASSTRAEQAPKLILTQPRRARARTDGKRATALSAGHKVRNSPRPSGATRRMRSTRR